MREKWKSFSITVLYDTFHIQTYISSAVMWLRNDFDHSIVLYPYFGKKNIFQKYIFYYNKVKSFFIEVFKTIQGVYSLKIALMQNLGLYL